MTAENLKLAVVGLGYVGLPLVVAFSQRKMVIGFDVNLKRVQELQIFNDVNGEFDHQTLSNLGSTKYTDNLADIAECNCFIVAVPTPVNEHNEPELNFLYQASELVGSILKPGDLVIYESTVYPGVTEDECGRILASVSGLSYINETSINHEKGFYLGYSPERINPGDKSHGLSDVIKVTSGSTPEIAEIVDSLYSTIALSGTYCAPSIKVAEAAKITENIQRDVNIALVNELATIFDVMGINTEDVLQAAETKWNFMSVRPGLVGGHCISVDPYYLTYIAQEKGYIPRLILEGRRINDGMGGYVSRRLLDLMGEHGINVEKAKVLILGLTFKENCADTRNSKVFDLIDELAKLDADIDAFDPWVDGNNTISNENFELVSLPKAGYYDVIVIAVPHSQFNELGIEGIRQFGKSDSIVFDIKYLFPAGDVDGRI